MMITLYEELLLLAIHEDKGIIIGSARERLAPGVVAAILAELALGGKICATNNHRLQVANSDPTNDVILDEALAILQGSEKERKFGYWLNNLVEKPDKLLKKIIKGMVQKGILSLEDDNLVWVIPSPLHPELNASAKYAVIQHLRSIVLAKEKAELKEITYLSLLSACGLLDLAFLRDERKVAGQYINELVVGEAMTEPLLETIQEIDAAIMGVVEEE